MRIMSRHDESSGILRGCEIPEGLNLAITRSSQKSHSYTIIRPIFSQVLSLFDQIQQPTIMSVITTEEFHGWLSHSHAAVDGKMEWAAFTPRPFQDDDIDIAVTHCAICHTDHGILAGELGPIDFPVCVGHEIVGHVVRVGPKAHQQFAVGDRVGVGAQSDACLNRPFLQSKPGHEHDSAGGGKTETLCSSCSTGQEQYCPKFIATYGSQRHYDGSIAMGGYATHIRTKSHFVFPIPDQLASADAAPMLCGGITTYSPLVRHGCGPGKSVAIVGLGGLGHFSVLWAKALKADSVLAISRSKSKKDDALKLGCDEYLASAEDGYAKAIKEREGTLDIILCTVSNAAVSAN